MFLGLDLGTSGVKAILMDEGERILAEGQAPLTVARPHPGWSEQAPADWIAAAGAAIDAVRGAAPEAWAGLRAIGVSGQMHGATLLGADDRPLRPAILWNDGRAGAECEELEARADFRGIGGNIVMAGFTAPKLAWVARHEPEVFAATRKVLLPKDYLNLWLTGEHVGEMSDAAGTLWLDVAARAWSEELLAATGLGLAHMPRLVEGCDAAGTLRPALAEA
ncbi:MAG: FGGY family carbohydrate kinase, partial [Pseudomonadota bacterium]